MFPIWLMWKQEEVTHRLTREHCAWPEPGCLLCSVCSGGLGKNRETFLRGHRYWGEDTPDPLQCSRGVQGSLGLHEQVLELGGLAFLHPGHRHRDLHGSRGRLRDRRGAQQRPGSPEGMQSPQGGGYTTHPSVLTLALGSLAPSVAGWGTPAGMSLLRSVSLTS